MGPLASSSDLARFHAARATLYHALAYLIGAPENERTRGIAQGILEETPLPMPAREALERALDIAGTVDCSSATDDRCLARGDGIRRDAFREVDQLERDCPGAEAEVLAALAERSARAIRRHELQEAAKLAELQYRFLAEHASGCLLGLAAALKGRRSERAHHLARAIELLVAGDLSMLDAGQQVR